MKRVQKVCSYALLFTALSATLVKSSLAQAFVFSNFEPTSTFDQTWSINNSNQLVGRCVTCNTDSGHYAWFFSGGSFNFFNHSAGDLLTSARAVNNVGQSAGEYLDASANVHGFLKTDGNFSDILIPNATFVRAFGLNDAGTVVGDFKDSTGAHGYHWNSGVASEINFAPNIIARAINNVNQIVGKYDDAGGTSHGFLLNDGSTQPDASITFPNPPGGLTIFTAAGGINGFGQVVGRWQDEVPFDHGFVWDSSTPNVYTGFNVPGSWGKTTPCPLPGKNCSSLFANGTNGATINDAGLIVGVYDDAVGNTHGFQLMIVHAKYALATTSSSCSAISLSGGSYIDSYDSASGPYSITTRSSAGANIATNGGASLSGGATIVYGTLYAPSVSTDTCNPLTTSGGAMVTGGDASLAQNLAYSNPPPSSPIAVNPPSTAYSQATIYPIQLPLANSIDTPPPSPIQTYGNLTFQKDVTFMPGVYTINSINAPGGVHLYIQGPVVLNLVGLNLGTKPALNLSGGSSFVNASGKASDLVITYAGSQAIELSGGSQGVGFVYAPNANVTLSGSSPWAGAIVSSTYVASAAALHYDVQLSK